MDREICVLVYSQYSPASKRVIEFIQSLPYDLVAITGMTMLAADTQTTREKLSNLNITTVPCIYVKYFDGKTVLYEDNMVYSFLDSIIVKLQKDDNTIELVEEIKEKEIKEPALEIYKRDDVMSAASSLLKKREALEQAQTKGPPLPPMNKVKTSKKTILI